MLFLMSMAKAKNTTKTQNSQLKSWHRFAHTYNVSLPVGGWYLTLYATQLVAEDRVKSADSLANYVSAVKGYHRDLGMDCVSPSQFGPLNRVIQGLRRAAQRPVRKSLPVTPTILLNLLNTTLSPPVCPYTQQVLATHKILALLYFLTMLRSSSLIPKTYGDVDPERLLCWGNVQTIYFGNIPGILLTLHKTKTIQNAERVQQVPLARNDACPILCPVRAINSLRGMFNDHEIGPDTPLFQTRNYQGYMRPVLYHKFQKWFKYRLKEMKLDASL